MKSLFIKSLIATAALCSCARKAMPVVITEKDSVNVRVRDTTIVRSSDVISINQAELDSIYKVLAEMKARGDKPVIEYRNAPNSPTNVKVSLDHAGKLVYDCGKDEEIISILLTEIDRLKVISKELPPPKAISKVAINAVIIAVLLLLTALILVIIKK